MYRLLTGCRRAKYLINQRTQDFTCDIYNLPFSFYGSRPSFVSNSQTLFFDVFCTLYPSLACLTAAGLHSDCLKLVNDWMVSDGPSSDLYILRARLHKLVHQVTTNT